MWRTKSRDQIGLIDDHVHVLDNVHVHVLDNVHVHDNRPRLTVTSTVTVTVAVTQNGPRSTHVEASSCQPGEAL
jgi:hypothetical protein